MRILVTGATGVVGRRVIPLLVSSGFDVTAGGRSPAKTATLSKLGAKPVLLDIFSADSARQRWPVMMPSLTSPRTFGP